MRPRKRPYAIGLAQSFSPLAFSVFRWYGTVAFGKRGGLRFCGVSVV